MIPSDYAISLATSEQLPCLAEIERACAACFPKDVLPEERRQDVVPLATLRDAHEQETLWVAVHARSTVVGYLVAQVHAADLYLVQLDVHPDHQRRGLGRALIEEAVRSARQRGLVGVTLTTFASIPWNGPWYHRLGFETLNLTGLPLHLRAQLAAEARAGLHDRVAMRLAI